MIDCLFCKIIRKEIPAEIVYESDMSLAFLDLHPVNPGHFLVVPKAHAADFASTPDADLADIAAVARKLAKAAMQATGAEGFNITVNNGRAAGQLVDHMHLHVMPRHTGDGLDLWHGKAYGQGEMAKVGDGIRAALKA